MLGGGEESSASLWQGTKDRHNNEGWKGVEDQAWWNLHNCATVNGYSRVR